MKRVTILLFIFFTLTSLTSCVEEISIEEYVGEPSGTLVVEGLITDEKQAHYVKLTRTTNVIPEGPADPVTGATVSVSDGETIYPLTENEIGSGIYLTDSTVQGEVGRTYTLTILIDGGRYEATDKMEPPNDFDEIDLLSVYVRPDKSGGYVNQLFTVAYGSYRPSMVSVEIVNPRPEDKYTEICYYSFPGADVDNIIPTPTESLEFVPGTVFRQTKYSLSKEHYLFLRDVLLETKYAGGVFGSVRANVPTNVSNGGLGFFGACSVKERLRKMK